MLNSNEGMDDKISDHKASVEKGGTIMNFWQYVLWHTQFVVILFLSVCKEIYVRDYIQVQSIVFQMIVDKLALMGIFYSGETLPEIFLKKIMALKGAF